MLSVNTEDYALFLIESSIMRAPNATQLVGSEGAEYLFTLIFVFIYDIAISVVYGEI